MEWTDKYKAVLESERWAALRSALIGCRKSICDGCGQKSEILQLHHQHYKTLGKEFSRDLLVLCVGCHEKSDEERQQVSDLRVNAYKKVKANISQGIRKREFFRPVKIVDFSPADIRRYVGNDFVGGQCSCFGSPVPLDRFYVSVNWTVTCSNCFPEEDESKVLFRLRLDPQWKWFVEDVE